MTPGYEIAEETGKKYFDSHESPRVRNGDGERVGLMRLLEEPLEVIRLEV